MNNQQFNSSLLAIITFVAFMFTAPIAFWALMLDGSEPISGNSINPFVTYGFPLLALCEIGVLAFAIRKIWNTRSNFKAEKK